MPKKAESTVKPRTSKATAKATFVLQVGQGFRLLTARVPGGEVPVAQAKGGSTLEVSYWKELQGSTAVDAIVFHGRVDGVTIPSMPVAMRDAEGRLVRAPATVNLPENGETLEYWFEVKPVEGEVMWDSNWGHNHTLSLTP
jgi:hypothetical protein